MVIAMEKEQQAWVGRLRSPRPDRLVVILRAFSALIPLFSNRLCDGQRCPLLAAHEQKCHGLARRYVVGANCRLSGRGLYGCFWLVVSAHFGPRARKVCTRRGIWSTRPQYRRCYPSQPAHARVGMPQLDVPAALPFRNRGSAAFV